MFCLILFYWKIWAKAGNREKLGENNRLAWEVKERAILSAIELIFSLSKWENVEKWYNEMDEKIDKLEVVAVRKM